MMKTYASYWAYAAVFSQVFEDSILHSVVYQSRNFNEVEVNYKIYDTEMLAIVSAVLICRY
jgi:hypothetical protein